MAEHVVEARFKQKYDTEANWKSKDPVLYEGEMAISRDKNGRYKVGDGKSKWSALSYAKADLTKADVTTALGYTPPTTNTTYSTGTATTAGIGKLYTGTGTATDGSMTQAAIKTALDGKSPTNHAHTSLTGHIGAEGFSFGYSDTKTITIAKTTAVQTNYIKIASGVSFRFKHYYIKTQGDNTQYSFLATISAQSYMDPHVDLDTQQYNGPEIKNILIYYVNNVFDIYLEIDSSTSVTKTVTIWADTTIGTTVTTTKPTGILKLTVPLSNSSYKYTSKPIIGSVSKLGTSNVGSATQPVYLATGSPKACTYTLGCSVPAGAKFTDTNTTYTTGTATYSGTTKLYTETGTATDGTMTQAAIKTALDGKSGTGHTHNYAGSSSAGGAANTAVKLANARTINNVSFDGSENITVTANCTENLLDSSADLNSITTYGMHYVGGANSIKNKPDNVDAFGLFVKRTAVGWTEQILYGINDKIYTRYYNGSAWSAWNQVYTTTNKPSKSDVGLGSVENKSSATIRGELTKANVTAALGYTPPTTNSWRGIQNNLTSDSTTDSLAAAQGKALNTAISTKADLLPIRSFSESSGTVGYIKLFTLTPTTAYCGSSYEFAIINRDYGVCYATVYLTSGNDRYVTTTFKYHGNNSSIGGNLKAFEYKDTTNKVTTVQVWIKIPNWGWYGFYPKTQGTRALSITWESSLSKASAFPTNATTTISPSIDTCYTNISGTLNIPNNTALKMNLSDGTAANVLIMGSTNVLHLGYGDSHTSMTIHSGSNGSATIVGAAYEPLIVSSSDKTASRIQFESKSGVMGRVGFNAKDAPPIWWTSGGTGYQIYSAKNIQSGTAAPASGFSGTPAKGDIYIQISA